jgi:hypothetical protein
LDKQPNDGQGTALRVAIGGKSAFGFLQLVYIIAELVVQKAPGIFTSKAEQAKRRAVSKYIAREGCFGFTLGIAKVLNTIAL